MPLEASQGPTGGKPGPDEGQLGANPGPARGQPRALKRQNKEKYENYFTHALALENTSLGTTGGQPGAHWRPARAR